MRLLDLFCGAGGAGMGYHRAGFEVVGVDIKPQKHYPFEFHCADAFAFLEKHGHEFDVIHASPPCQFYCAMKTMKNKRQHEDLVGTTRDALALIGKPYVIENVFGAPLFHPLMLCGSFFGLQSHGFQLRRHRYFESSLLMLNGNGCDHADKTLGIYGAKVRNIAQEKRHYAQDKGTRGKPDGVMLPHKYGFESMQIDWMNIEELSLSIPPAYTEWIGQRLREALQD